jgi:outer membrane protein TolC
MTLRFKFIKHLQMGLPIVAFCMQISGASAQLTIEECQEKARNNYPAIRQLDLITKSTEYTISNANKAFLPQISLTGIGAYIISGLPAISLPGAEPPSEDKTKFIGFAQLNQAIWDGGATRSSRDIAQANSEVDKANVEVSLHAIRSRVNQLYFGILVIDEQSRNLDIAYETLTRNLNKLKLSQANGLAFQTDVDEVKAEMLNLDQKKIEFKFARKGYVDMLGHMVGQPLSETVNLKKPDAIEVEGQESNRPELKLFANQSKLIESQNSFNKSMNMPRVGLMGAAVLISPGAQFATSTLSSIAFAGLSVSWSTSNIYKSSNTRDLNRIHLDRIKNNQETFVFTNSLELLQSKNEIDKQRSVLEKDNEIVALKANIKKSYQLRYDNGQTTMNDLINSINKENEALSNRGLHEVQLLMNMYNFKTISGN